MTARAARLGLVTFGVAFAFAATSQSSAAQDGASRPAAALLTVISGPDAGLQVNLPSGSVTIGRAADCDVRLTDTMVSKRHARLNVGAHVEIQVRHRAKPAAAEIVRLDGGEIELALDEPVSAITPGQSLVIYDGERVLGGGFIERAAGQRAPLPVRAA